MRKETWAAALSAQIAPDCASGSTGADAVNRILRWAGVTRAKDILVVGPGGDSEPKAIRAFTHGTVHVVAPCSTEAAACAAAGFRTIRADMHDMEGVETAAYDLIYAGQVLEHAISPYLALLACRRVARNAAYLVLHVPIFAGDHNGRLPLHLYCMDPALWEELLCKTGWSVLTAERLSVTPAGDWWAAVCCAVAPVPPHDTVLAALCEIASGRADPMLAYRAFWQIAGTFSPDKCSVYPEHETIQEFARARDKIVLEYGCGGGSDGLSYLRAGAQQVVFVDIVSANLKLARSRVVEAGFAGRARFWHLRRSDGLPDSAFDVVNAHGVLHHIPDVDPIVRAMVARLRDGGRIYAMLYTEKMYAHHKARVDAGVACGMTAEQALGVATDGPGCPYGRAYTESEGTALFVRNGLNVIGVHTYNGGLFRTYVATKR